MGQDSQLGRIAVVGAGAVGLYYGARLAQAGHDVHFLLRSDYEQVREHGIRVDSVDGDFSIEHVNCASETSEIGKVDLVIVAWKATANHQAEEIMTPLIGENTKLLILQNGLGNCEFYAGLFGAHRIYGGLCFVCINRISPGYVQHTASGLIRMGAYRGCEEPEGWLENFNAAGFPCEWVDSLEKAQWMKLVWNIPFNGLAIAEGGVNTAELLGELGLENEVREIMREVIACALAYGHQIDDSFIDHQIAITRPMKGYKPSSMIDFVEGRSVEIDAIWAEPLRRAKEKSLVVPQIENLYERIKGAVEAR